MLRTRVRAGPIAGLVLSLVAAVVLTVVQVGDGLFRPLAPAWDQPAPMTIRVPYGPRLVRDAATGRADVRFEHRRVVVPRGTVLVESDPTHQMAVSFEQARHTGPRLIGLFVILFTAAMALTSYLRKFGQNRLRLLRVQIGLFAAIGILTVVAKSLLLFTALPEYWVPIAAVPLWVAASFDRRTAFVVTVVLSFIVATLLRFDLIFLTVMLSVGMSATLLYLDRKRSRHMILSGVLAGLSSASLLVAIIVTVEGHFDLARDLQDLSSSTLLATFGGAAGSGLLGAALRSPAERLLGNVPRERLLDLTDLEQPLLQKMAREAPGSWEHSRMMANLAEQAASAIGVDALLTRVGAYYHDLGKTTQAKYFVENLAPDERSPHEDLEPEVSADAIMTHVVMGTQILRDGGIPEPVVEFAYTHHGTQRVEFFWNKCQEQGNPKGLDESAFRYPGMKPQTKETAILMLVDSIEAASRTVDQPDREQFELMIQRILFTKLKAGQLDESGLAVEDLRILVNRMAGTLVNMYHHRIKYPWQAERAEEFGVPSDAVGRSSSPEIELRMGSSLPPGIASEPPATRPSGPDEVTEPTGVRKKK